MKPFPASACLCLILAAQSQDAHSATGNIELKAIVSWSTNRLALFEDKTARSPWERHLILSPGQRTGDLELLGLDPVSETAKVFHRGQTYQLKLGGGSSQAGVMEPSREPGAAMLKVVQATPESLFPVYQELTTRTLLRGTRLPEAVVDLCFTNGASADDLAQALVTALSERGVIIRPHREKFAIAAAKEADFGKVSLVQAPETAAPTHTPAQVLPPGMINFPNTDLNQVLRFYAELAGATVLRPMTLPAPTITLHTANALTRAEAQFAVEASFALNDLSVRRVGEKFVLVFPTFQTNGVSALLSQKPVVHPAATNAVPRVSLNFRSAKLSQVAATYGRLSGQPVEIAPSVPGIALTFRCDSLPREQVLYGLELLFGVNRLAVVPQESGPGLRIVVTGVSTKN